jgi:hypothetical protein
VTVTVVNNPEHSRYEAILDDRVVGFAAYQARPEATVFTHTEVDDAVEGKGVGSALAKGALDDVRAQGGAVVALCPFISAYIKRHSEYEDLLAERAR